MKIIKLEQAEKHSNSDKCKTLEYSFNDKDIDCATATITGRYPDTGYCMNEECKELIYVIDGRGTLNKENETIKFKKGDAILINKGEKYYWNAQCTIVMPCTPAWYPEQHKLIDN